METKTIKILMYKNPGKHVEVQAECNGDFAFHQAYNDEDAYHVTHIPTGLNCSGGYSLGPLAAAELRDHYAKLDIPENATQAELAEILEKAFIEFSRWAGWDYPEEEETEGDQE